MYKFDQVKKAHIEITSRCQAACAQCHRNIHGGGENTVLPIRDWTLDDFKQIFTGRVLQHLEEIIFSGNFGDPMINDELPAMCEYVRENAPNIYIQINTNGSARTTAWWQNLVTCLPDHHDIIFALDGVDQATHQLHRTNTNYQKVLDNAIAVIQAGGRAGWQFIRFRHNEHQTETARQLAEQYRFARFDVKNSRRFGNEGFSVINTSGIKTHRLEAPSDKPLRFVRGVDVIDWAEWPRRTEIQCYAAAEREIFIDAQCTLLPCCMLAAFLYTDYSVERYQALGVYDPESGTVEQASTVQDNVWSIVDRMGGLAVLDARQGVEQIVDSELWQRIWPELWQNSASSGCIIMCSSDSPYVNIDSQFEKE